MKGEAFRYFLRYKEYGLLVAFAFLLYGNTLNHSYTLDDAIVISENKYTKQGIEGIGELLTEETFTGFFGEKKNLVAGGRYRPLSMVTFALEYEFFGLNPLVGHLVNILLYALTGILLFLIIQRLWPSTGSFANHASFLIAALFLAHPVHTEVVANIKGRDEIMALLFSLLALKSSIQWIETQKPFQMLLVFLYMFLALLSKENAITFVAVIPLVFYFFKNQDFKRSFWLMIPLMVSVVLFILIRQSVLGSGFSKASAELMNNPFLHASISEKYATIVYTLGYYIKLLLFPHPLTFDYYPYHIPLVNWSNPWVVISLLLYLVMGLYALLFYQKKGIVSFSILYFIFTLSIVSNLFFPIGAFMNERFIYMPSIGFIIALYAGLHLLSMRLKRVSPLLLVLLLLLPYSAKTIHRNQAWKDDFTLFTTDVKTSVNSAKSNCTAGGKLSEKAMEISDSLTRDSLLAVSMVYLNRSINVYPGYTDALLLLGNAHYNRYKNIDSAFHYYERILKYNPTYSLVHSNMDNILGQTEDVDTKIMYYQRLKGYYPNRFEINYNLGHLYGKYKNDLPTATQYLERAVTLNPKSAIAWKDYGVAMAISGKYDKAIEAYSKALALTPEDPDLYANMGMTYMQLNQQDKAAAFFKRAQELKTK